MPIISGVTAKRFVQIHALGCNLQLSVSDVTLIPPVLLSSTALKRLGELEAATGAPSIAVSANMVFTLRPSAHLGSLATGHALGTISRSSDIARFVQGGVVKTFR